MSAFPDPKWLDALSLPARVTGGLFAACCIVLLVDKQVTPLLPVNVQPWVIIGAIVAGSLFAFTLGSLGISTYSKSRKSTLLELRRKARKQEQRDNYDEARAKTMKRIDSLSSGELRYLADALRENSQSFKAWFMSGDVANLLQKGFLNSPAGTFHRDYNPYWIADDVWKELQARRDELLAKDTANQQAEKAQKR